MRNRHIKTVDKTKKLYKDYDHLYRLAMSQNLRYKDNRFDDKVTPEQIVYLLATQRLETPMRLNFKV